MVSEIPRVSVFGTCPYSVTFPYSSFMFQTNQHLCLFEYLIDPFSHFLSYILYVNATNVIPLMNH